LNKYYSIYYGDSKEVEKITDDLDRISQSKQSKSNQLEFRKIAERQ